MPREKKKSRKKRMKRDDADADADADASQPPSTMPHGVADPFPLDLTPDERQKGQEVDHDWELDCGLEDVQLEMGQEAEETSPQDGGQMAHLADIAVRDQAPQLGLGLGPGLNPGTGPGPGLGSGLGPGLGSVVTPNTVVEDPLWVHIPRDEPAQRGPDVDSGSEVECALDNVVVSFEDLDDM
jgi:hypothetical protein